METTNPILNFFLKPFLIGLYIGLLGCLVIYIRSKIKGRKFKKEIGRLKQHIQTKLEIEAETTERTKKNIEDLKSQVENLKISLQAYYEKPGRREIRQLHVYQKAVDILTEKAPGFAQSWLSALKESEGEIRKTEKGLIPFIRRLIPGTAASSSTLENVSDNKTN
jgi:uncharacterized membrane protein YciS (DUF1049 family)